MTTKPTRSSDLDRLMTVGEAARYLRLRDRVARKWLDENGLLLRIAGRRRVHRESLVAALFGEQGRPVAAPRPTEADGRRRVPIPQTDAF